MATTNLSVSERISLTTKRRDGAVNNMTTHQSADAHTADSGSTTNAIQALFTFVILSSYVSMGRSRIYALIDEGIFPPPLKIGRSSRWVKSEIDSWIAAQVSARQSAQRGA
jgi:prophage regulatory protein